MLLNMSCTACGVHAQKLAEEKVSASAPGDTSDPSVAKALYHSSLQAYACLGWVQERASEIASLVSLVMGFPTPSKRQGGSLTARLYCTEQLDMNDTGAGRLFQASRCAFSSWCDLCAWIICSPAATPLWSRPPKHPSLNSPPCPELRPLTRLVSLVHQITQM